MVGLLDSGLAICGFDGHVCVAICRPAKYCDD